jgi:P27 family predicted phage terminase small subunit
MAKTRGRKPKPTGIKLHEGNPGKRPINTNEPQPEAGEPDCPERVRDDPVAFRAWGWLVEQLRAMDIITLADRMILEQAATIYSRWYKATDQIAEHGEIETTAIRTNAKGNEIGGGNTRVSPWMQIANRSEQQLDALFGELGLTPSARTRLMTNPNQRKKGLTAFAASRDNSM